MHRYKILVAGCGSIGQRHARLLSERADVALYIADPVKECLEKCAALSAPLQLFSDYEDALAEGMDGALICTPNHLHVDMAIKALDAGAHVFIEKPVAETSIEARQLLAHQDRAGREVLVGYVLRFDKQLNYVKHLVDTGVLGQVVYASASVYAYNTLWQAKTSFRVEREWSLVVDYTHDLDYLRYLLGDVEQVSAMGATKGELELIAKPNVVQIVLRFANGTLGSVHMDYVRDPGKRFLELVGDKGSVEFDMMHGVVKFYEKNCPGFQETAKAFERDDLFRDQIGNFMNVIGGSEKPLVSLADGIRVLEVAEAVIESCRTGRFVSLQSGAVCPVD